VTDGQGWNDGQLSRNERQRRALMRRVTDDGQGHWIWTGDVNAWGYPIVRIGADVVSAGDAFYALWKRAQKPPEMQHCHRRRCVNPDCWWRRA
jgi:hypothetical protein